MASKFLDLNGLEYLWQKIKSLIPRKTAGILYGQVDSTSSATKFTATVDGIDELYDGVAVYLHNGVIASASGWTLNINNLGALPVYSSMAAATRVTTQFNANVTALFIYNSNRVSGGCWDFFYGWDTDANSIGYQLRTNSSNLTATDAAARYRMWFTSADNNHWVPANTSTDTGATAKRTPNTRPINPFGRIVYRSVNGSVSANAGLGPTSYWDQYYFNLGYSFNDTGSALTLSYPAPVYLKCTPLDDGSAKMIGIVQSLPTSKDGFIYIMLGVAGSATNIELQEVKPVYWHDGTGIRIWTGAKPSEGGGGTWEDIDHLFTWPDASSTYFASTDGNLVSIMWEGSMENFAIVVPDDYVPAIPPILFIYNGDDPSTYYPAYFDFVGNSIGIVCPDGDGMTDAYLHALYKI